MQNFNPTTFSTGHVWSFLSHSEVFWLLWCCGRMGFLLQSGVLHRILYTAASAVVLVDLRFRFLSLYPNYCRWQLSGPTCLFPRDVFNGPALIPTDDSEEVTAVLERSACRRNCKPVRPSACLFTRVSLPPIWKPLHLVRTITPCPLVSPTLP